ncbi:hypothetical protein AS156_33500 [Bradyrhizobium macuxiense]|uniref:Tetratricopeptide repeat protein n=1 Tax=Bradyrhizobium macuxiense TaxID=1755647 RepID=A0A109K0E7_9BRAD|nr:hypothetical protein [Bradyrhizobium macuxiense]KWV58511.1 hypothetical protein AS156_33500 [Bradyrhizobium macuxiense]
MALAVTVGSYAFVSAVAGTKALERVPFPSDAAKISSPWVGDVPSFSEILLPFASELESNHALITALQVLEASRKKQMTVQSAEYADAIRRVRQTLSISPYNPELWLALALLQAQRDPHDPVVFEALKMTYFIAPNDMRLVPVRLDVAGRFDLLADPDIKDLARSDVRLIMTRRPELKPAIVSAFRRASDRGKAALQDAVQSIDPTFVPSLRG